MISKERLEIMAQKYQAKAERAYRNYQETGVQRYERERINAEDLADALTAAANAAEEHNRLHLLQAHVNLYAADLERALQRGFERGEIEPLINGFIATAVSLCKYRRLENVGVSE